LLFGLAAATRAELILAVPAVVLSGCFTTGVGSGLRLRIPIAELGIALIATTLFVSNFWAHYSVSPAPKRELEGRSRSPWERMKEDTGLIGPTDLGGLKRLARLVDYPTLLNKARLAQQFCPLPLLALVSLVPFALAVAGDERSIGLVRPASLLILIGWTLWFGWILRASPSHLRYITPALACFSIVGGLGMARLYGWARDTGHELAVTGLLLLAAAEVLGGAEGTFRSLVHGEHDFQSFEWAGGGLGYFRRFQHIQDQRAAMACIERSVPNDALLLVSTQNYIFRYLLNRPVVRIDELDPDELTSRRPTYLILSPPVVYLNPEGFDWIERNCRLVCQYGRYSIYEVLNPLPQDLGILQIGRYARHPLSDYWFGMGPPGKPRDQRDRNVR
jgi:hypothetical protein